MNKRDFSYLFSASPFFVKWKRVKIMNNDLWKNWVLCEYDVSPRLVQSLIEKRISVEDIHTMSAEAFSIAMGSTKKALYYKISKIFSENHLEKCLDEPSIYLLLAHGASKGLVDTLFKSGLSDRKSVV